MGDAWFFYHLLVIPLGAIIIYGGLQTIRRASYSLSMIAAILAIISYGFFVSVMLGSIALMIAYRSKGDFENELSLRGQITETISKMKRQEV